VRWLERLTDLIAGAEDGISEREAARRLHRPSTRDRASNARLQAAGAARVRQERSDRGDWAGARQADKLVKRKTARAKEWDTRGRFAR